MSTKEENEALQVEEPHQDSAVVHIDESHPESSAPGAGDSPAPLLPPHDPQVPCVQCGKPIGPLRGAETASGPLHHNCILQYRFLHQPRCHYCGIRFLDREANEFVKDEENGKLFHQECHTHFKAGVPYVKPSKEGEVKKFSIARSKLSRKNWKKRYFILSPSIGGIRYYKSNPAGGAGDKDKDKDKGKSKSGNESSSASGEDVDEDVYDPDADPDREARLNSAKSKGDVPLDERSRLITRPAVSNYKIDSPAASDRYDIGVIFFETKESSIERRLVFQCKDAEEYKAWVRALEAYIYIVDDPEDYKSKEKKDEKKKKKSNDDNSD